MTSLLAAILWWSVDAGQLCQFPPASGAFRVVILRAVDGDTVDVGLIVPLRVRLFGVNAPELSDAQGPAARQALEEWLGQGPVVLELRGRDKYGRALGELRRGQESAGDVLIRRGLAHPYRP